MGEENAVVDDILEIVDTLVKDETISEEFILAQS